MRNLKSILFSGLLFVGSATLAQHTDSLIINSIVKEATGNSQLEKLAHELVDGIGPRLVGTPQMTQAKDWAIKKYGEWGIPARMETWGEWRGWERGATHVDMVSPRVKSLESIQLT